MTVDECAAQNKYAEQGWDSDKCTANDKVDECTAEAITKGGGCVTGVDSAEYSYWYQVALEH